jgi:4-hydroxy-3-polyprenylbenzoate decarboxylase
MRLTVPEIVDYDLPVAGGVPQLCIVSIRKAFPGPRAEGDARDLGARMLSLTKGVIVVDEHVDVHDTSRSPSTSGRTSTRSATSSSRGPLDHLDHAPTRQFVGGKLGIDATAKGPTRARASGRRRSR